MSSHIPDYAADMYDLWYEAAGKDYEGEAHKLLVRAQELVPDAKTLLDVACGTGMHARSFVDGGVSVTGVDLLPEFVERAAERVPEAFDIVACCFSAIGHVKSAAELDAAIASMAAHVAPGGVLFVEPWFAPEQWNEGAAHALTVKRDGFIATRANVSRRKGDMAVLHFICSAANTERVWTWEEYHELLLATPQRYEAAFEHAGMTATFEADVLPRGAWVSRHQAAAALS